AALVSGTGVGERWRGRRIVAARMKRVTLTQSLDQKQPPPQCSMKPDALEGVGRAGRCESAHRPEQGPDQLRERQLIGADEQHEQARHHVATIAPSLRTAKGPFLAVRAFGSRSVVGKSMKRNS